jgi:hypothetical protein
MACRACGAVLGDAYGALVHRVRRLEFKEVNGKAHTTEIVLSSHVEPGWCSQACWETMADAMVAALGLAFPYPKTAPVVPCSCCGGPVDTTNAHVAYAVLGLQISDSPWATTAKVQWSRLLAVLCLQCEGPDGHQAGVAREIPTPGDEVRTARGEHETA